MTKKHKAATTLRITGKVLGGAARAIKITTRATSSTIGWTNDTVTGGRKYRRQAATAHDRIRAALEHLDAELRWRDARIAQLEKQVRQLGGRP